MNRTDVVSDEYEHCGAVTLFQNLTQGLLSRRREVLALVKDFSTTADAHALLSTYALEGTDEVDTALVRGVGDAVVAGVEEMRPVVEFDVRFGVKQFKKIKFSLADRGENNYPVLVGKEFLTRTKHSVNVARTFTLFESNLDERFSKQMAQIPT